MRVRKGEEKRKKINSVIQIQNLNTNTKHERTQHTQP